MGGGGWVGWCEKRGGCVGVAVGVGGLVWV